ncbi:MAG: metal ABC transporter permease, partial [Phycisphaerales bacterium JB059]
MSPSTYLFFSIDLPAMLAGTLAAMTCALLGNFLVLRRQSLMGDAISHAVLPGIVVGFLVAGTRRTLPIFIGAGVSAMLTVFMINALRRVARVEAGAAMGVSFSILFALGVLLIEQAAARHVDLDADCVLYGQLEYINWTPPGTWSELLSASTLSSLPRQVVVLLGALLLVSAFVLAFYKELRLATFDPAHASAIGFSAPRLNAALMVLVAGATVAAFEAVGSILVIAMLITPPATARLLTDRYTTQLLLSVFFAAGAGVLGYFSGAFLPDALGLEGGALNAAGAMTVVGVLILIVVIVFAP